MADRPQVRSTTPPGKLHVEWTWSLGGHQASRHRLRSLQPDPARAAATTERGADAREVTQSALRFMNAAPVPGAALSVIQADWGGNLNHDGRALSDEPFVERLRHPAFGQEPMVAFDRFRIA